MFTLIAATLLSSLNPAQMPSEEIDRELTAFFQAKGAFLLHPLTHLICGHAERKSKNDEIFAKYEGLEQEYERLGGTFLPDSQTILEEGGHYSCPIHSTDPGKEWMEETANIESQLSAAGLLLAEKESRQH